MRLVDTASWIDYLRPNGNSAVKKRVEDLLSDSEAAWCDAIQLELWNGAAGDAVRAYLRRLRLIVRNFEIDSQVWQVSIDLSQKARAKGLTVPAVDLVIAACAIRHGIEVESPDGHFRALSEID